MRSWIATSVKLVLKEYKNRYQHKIYSWHSFDNLQKAVNEREMEGLIINCRKTESVVLQQKDQQKMQINIGDDKIR